MLVESLALLQHRLGTATAVKLAESASGFEIIWVGKQLHEEAARRLARAVYLLVSGPRRSHGLRRHVTLPR